jgi:hypothetical protein
MKLNAKTQEAIVLRPRQHTQGPTSVSSALYNFVRLGVQGAPWSSNIDSIVITTPTRRIADYTVAAPSPPDARPLMGSVRVAHRSPCQAPELWLLFLGMMFGKVKAPQKDPGLYTSMSTSGRFVSAGPDRM